MVNTLTKRWIRNESDELAVANGCRFNEERAQDVLDFAQEHCVLYEGDKAGQTLEPMPWQVEVTMRLFGWEAYSDYWGRWIRRFRQASIWVPKKNGKSPTLAWWGLYLLCADGEMGQHVYSAAKDGTQAKIAHTHAVQMVDLSPTLAMECDVHRSTLQITHAESRSNYTILSSDNAKAQKAKEGLNGSILIDETHVVDRAFVARVKRAGISRSEPLLIEASTVGDEPESYGRERYDYGKRVESGEEENQELLFVGYEAPQNLTDEQIDADPLKWGKIANPAWGHTVNPDEFLNDYRESRPSISAFCDFKKYRLNIWQQSSNPWLRMEDWRRCAGEFALEDFYGQNVWGGLDLSQTRDMSALVLLFQLDNAVLQWPIFWLPEKYANEKRKLVPYLDWARDGHLRLIEGATIKTAVIRETILWVRETFILNRIHYDKKYAHHLCDELIEDYDMDEQLIEFDQRGIMMFAATGNYEKAILDGTLKHPDNPVLTWQAGHVHYKEDAEGKGKRPVKPAKDHRTIDGIVAGIMGYDAVLRGGLDFFDPTCFVTADG